MEIKSPEVYLSKSEILLFFRVSNDDVNYLIKNELLIPSNRGGTIKYGISNILGAVFVMDKWKKTE